LTPVLFGQCENLLITGDIELFNTNVSKFAGQFGQFQRLIGLPAAGDNIPAAGCILTRELKTETTVGAGYQYRWLIGIEFC
jgi:hypothetical protein